jgi:hypothetical protein
MCEKCIEPDDHYERMARMISDKRTEPGFIRARELDRSSHYFSGFDHRCTIPIPFTIVVSVTLADGHADANRTYAYSDFLGQQATSKRQCRPIVRNFCKDTGSDIICV